MDPGDLRQRVGELEARVRVLEQENELLAERGEDILLLGLIAEEINACDDVNDIVNAVLERISLLKDIPLCAYCSFADETVSVLNSFVSFSHKVLSPEGVCLSREALKTIGAGALLLRRDNHENQFRIVFEEPFEPKVLFVVPSKTRVNSRGLFLFAEDGQEERISHMTAVLARAVDMVGARMDNVSLMGELKLLNRELDRKVLERTKDLWLLTRELQQEVDERKRTEEELRTSRGRFESLIESAGDGVFVIDLATGEIVDVNTQACTSLGYGKDELIGMALPEVDVGFDERTVTQLRETLAMGETMTVEGLHRRKDGTTFPVEVRVGLMHGTGKAYSISLARDITERRKLEDELVQIRKMDSVGRLAGGIAHDFNNMLSTILGYTELSLMELEDNPRVREKLEQVRNAGQRAANLTRQLLAFGRKQTLRIEQVNLRTTVDSMLKMLGRMIGEDVIIEVRNGDDLLDILADQSQVEQVLMNLVVNARDAMPGGGRLYIETNCMDIREEDLQSFGGEIESDTYVTLSVTDSGCGMDRETQERIFEPFFTTKELGKGTGLGLATVYGIVKQHNGHIRVYSEVGTGSTFKIFWPAASGAATKIEPRGEEIFPRGTETILVVDDEDSIRSLVRDTLTPLGYTVLESETGAKALDMIGTTTDLGRVDLLLSDVIMPEMSGGELAASFIDRVPGLKVVFMSGYPDERILRQGILPEGIAFLQKPLTPSRLISAVRKTLDFPRKESG